MRPRNLQEDVIQVDMIRLSTPGSAVEVERRKWVLGGKVYRIW